jgi:pilus assembly protein Flp/PilA
LPRTASVKNEDNRRPALPTSLVGESCRRHRGDIERQAELLGNLADQGKARIFLGFYLAAGEFPLPGVGLSGQSLLQQEPPRIVADRGGDDRQPCRFFCHTRPSRELFLNAAMSQRSTGTKTGGSNAMKILLTFRAILADTRGATAIEYALILSLIFLAMMGGVEAFSTQLIAVWNKVSSTSANAMAGSV